MSTLRKYQANDGAIGYTRIDSSGGWADIAGDGPAGVANASVYFYKNKSRRSPGAQVRRLNLRTPDGPVTPGGQQPYKFASATVLTADDFAAYQIGDTFTLNGVVYTCYSKSDEG